MLDQIVLLLKALGEPEYLYLLLEPAFIYGVGIGLVVFVCGFFLRDVKTQVLGLVAIIVSSLIIFPYLKFRTEAEPRISKVYQIESPRMVTEFKDQSSRYSEHRWAYLGLTAVAGAVLLVGGRTNRVGLALSVLTVFAAVWVVVFSMTMHLKESQIHHPNLLALKQQLAGAGR